jgi:hypothetical protein
VYSGLDRGKIIFIPVFNGNCVENICFPQEVELLLEAYLADLEEIEQGIKHMKVKSRLHTQKKYLT